MDVHAWSNFTTECGPLVQLKCRIWIYFRSALRQQHDSLEAQHDPTKTPKPFSREIQGVDLVEKNNMKHIYRQLTKSMLSPLHHSWMDYHLLSGLTWFILMDMDWPNGYRVQLVVEIHLGMPWLLSFLSKRNVAPPDCRRHAPRQTSTFIEDLQ